MAIFTHSSLLVIEFVRAEGIEQGKGEAFTQSLYSWNVLTLSGKQTKCALFIIVCIKTMKSNIVQLV